MRGIHSGEILDDQRQTWETPGGPAVRTALSVQGPGFNPWSETKILQAPGPGTKKKRKKERKKTKIDLTVAFKGVGWRGNRGHSHIKIMEKDLARATS